MEDGELIDPMEKLVRKEKSLILIIALSKSLKLIKIKAIKPMPATSIPAIIVRIKLIRESFKSSFFSRIDSI